jgi:hypothetical protein
VFGRRRLAAERRPALARDERILAWAASGEAPSEVVVATNLGLWLPGPPSRRLPWSEIHKAAWSGQELVITPAARVTEIEGYAVMADQPVERFRLAEPGDIPSQVRGRVTRSVAYTAHHPLPGGGGVRVVARRVSGVDGLRWSVRYDNGADVTDPVVREVTTQLVTQAQETLDQ